LRELLEKDSLSSRLYKILSYADLTPSKYYRTIQPPQNTHKKQKVFSIFSKDPLESTVIKCALNHPLLGYKKVHHILKKREKIVINKKRVYKILKENDLLKKRKNRVKEIQEKYKKKLSELMPKASNEVWQMDVTYVYVDHYGWYYQIDVQDYYSKYVLIQHFTDSYSAKEAIIALRAAVNEAERLHGDIKNPISLVTDNGSSFIAKLWRKSLTEIKNSEDIKIFDQIRIGYRMPEQIGSIERFHGNIKQECVYQNWFTDPLEAESTLKNYGAYYNYERPHWGIKLDTPAEKYLNKEYQETLKFKPKQVDFTDLRNLQKSFA